MTIFPRAGSPRSTSSISMLAVEAEFDVKIPDGQMTPSNFRSIAHIAKLLGELK